LYSDPERYGQDSVGINTNGVHLSAGPFEAAFEVVNFFGPLTDYDLHETPPLILNNMIKAGITEENAADLLNNPPVAESDLFSETENLNTYAAIELANEKIFKNE
jgi:hypothetical protein